MQRVDFSCWLSRYMSAYAKNRRRLRVQDLCLLTPSKTEDFDSKRPSEERPGCQAQRKKPRLLFFRNPASATTSYLKSWPQSLGDEQTPRVRSRGLQQITLLSGARKLAQYTMQCTVPLCSPMHYSQVAQVQQAGSIILPP